MHTSRPALCGKCRQDEFGANQTSLWGKVFLWDFGKNVKVRTWLWLVTVITNIKHLSLCCVLMGQEHESCMCIPNVIPSHQMAYFAETPSFFFFNSSPISAQPLPPSSSFCTSCTIPLFRSIPYIHILSFTLLRILHPRLLLTPSLLCFAISPLSLFYFLSHPHHAMLSGSHYHQSMTEVLIQQLWLRPSVLQCWSAHTHTHTHTSWCQWESWAGYDSLLTRAPISLLTVKPLGL